jgi:hypothetical protein
MRDLSPDYLQGFMSYVDTLIWLEQANPLKAAAARSGAGEEAKVVRQTQHGKALTGRRLTFAAAPQITCIAGPRPPAPRESATAGS